MQEGYVLQLQNSVLLCAMLRSSVALKVMVVVLISAAVTAAAAAAVTAAALSVSLYTDAHH